MKNLFTIIENKKISDKSNECFSLIEKMDTRFSEFTPLFQNNENSENALDTNENKFQNEIIFKELGNNHEFMEKRAKELENVKIISSQVVDISTAIKMETYQQGEIINEVENNLTEMNVNLNKANKEAKETEILLKKSKKTLYFICISIFAIFVLIVFFVLKLIK